ncbi:MAG: transposase [Actinobacteria bacterium]|nr:MAG: transposase [Actinomycetota bacterium]
MGTEPGSGVRPKRSRIIELYTDPPPGSTVVCVDELGPVTPRAFPPAPGWSPDGHRIKAPLKYGRGPDKVWVFGALRVKDGKSLTFTSRSRNSKGYLRLLQKIERAIPEGLVYLIADNLKTHKSVLVRAWLEEHPRIEHAFIPKGAAWLNLIEVWWRLFRRQALAGQDFADSYEIDQATRVATRQLNRKSNPWVWGRPPKPPRHRRRKFVYRL